MGKIIRGILGGFSGLVGTVVGANWRGIDTIRARPKKSNIPATVPQLSQQGGFTIMSGFLQEVRDVLLFGFQSYKTGQTPYNAAFSYNLKHAIGGVYPMQTVTYANVKLANGGLRGISGAAAVSAVSSEIDFSWTVNAPAGHARLTDKITAVVFCPTVYQFAWVENVVARSAGEYTMSLPAEFGGEIVHTWLFFASADKKKVSDSVYVGPVTVL
ncbi:DUF6266 family protein [Pedobacter sp. PWIIR3]